MTYAIITSLFEFGVVLIATFDLVSECCQWIEVLSARTISYSLPAFQVYVVRFLTGAYKEVIL